MIYEEDTAGDAYAGYIIIETRCGIVLGRDDNVAGSTAQETSSPFLGKDYKAVSVNGAGNPVKIFVNFLSSLFLGDVTLTFTL